MKINPEALRFYLRRLVPRKPLPVIAKETGIDVEKLEKALKEPIDFSYKELRRLGIALGVSSYFLTVDKVHELKHDADRFKFRQLARTRKGKVVWFEVFPESRDCGVIDTPHTGLHYLKDPLSPVLQCTGFTDERDVPIYEEDVVEVEGVGVGIVVWEEGSFCITFYRGNPAVLPPGKMVDVYDVFFVKKWKVKVLGNSYIAHPSLYNALLNEFKDMEVDDTTFLRTVIYTGVKRPDGDDVVLYLEKDFNEDRLYLTDLGETAMFIASCGIEPGFEEVRKEVNEENVVEKTKEMIEEITSRFRQRVGHIKFEGKRGLKEVNHKP